MRTVVHFPVIALLVLLGLGPVWVTAQDSNPVPNLRALPFAEWLEEGETEQINWDIDINESQLRMEQRIDLTFVGSVRARDLEPRDINHRLALWSWVLNSEGGIETYSGPVQYFMGQDVPRNAEVQFFMRLFVTPGDYTLSLLLYDETTGQHNLTRERVRVDDIDDDPFPDSFRDLPVVEFPASRRSGGREFTEVSGDLFMPINSVRPLEIQLISALSAPENRPGERSRVRHTNNMSRVLIALTQLDPTEGSIAVSGLDLVRREVVFEQKHVKKLDTVGLARAFADSNPPAIGIDALTGRHLNSTFVKEYVEDQVEGRIIDGGTELSRVGTPLKVLIFVTGFTLFDDDSNVTGVDLEGRCDCRVYHIRVRQNLRDVFDDVDNILEPLYPKTFNVLTPEDLRDAMGEIVEDLERF
jgi:hypothetical protein